MSCEDNDDMHLRLWYRMDLNEVVARKTEVVSERKGDGSRDAEEDTAGIHEGQGKGEERDVAEGKQVGGSSEFAAHRWMIQLCIIASRPAARRHVCRNENGNVLQVT